MAYVRRRRPQFASVAAASLTLCIPAMTEAGRPRRPSTALYVPQAVPRRVAGTNSALSAFAVLPAIPQHMPYSVERPHLPAGARKPKPDVFQGIDPSAANNPSAASNRPIMLVLTPSILKRKSGRLLTTVSLETSMKKLVRLTVHTLRGKSRTLACSGILTSLVVIAALRELKAARAESAFRPPHRSAAPLPE